MGLDVSPQERDRKKNSGGNRRNQIKLDWLSTDWTPLHAPIFYPWMQYRSSSPPGVCVHSPPRWCTFFILLPADDNIFLISARALTFYWMGLDAIGSSIIMIMSGSWVYTGEKATITRKIDWIARTKGCCRRSVGVNRGIITQPNCIVTRPFDRTRRES